MKIICFETSPRFIDSGFNTPQKCNSYESSIVKSDNFTIDNQVKSAAHNRLKYRLCKLINYNKDFFSFCE